MYFETNALTSTAKAVYMIVSRVIYGALILLLMFVVHIYRIITNTIAFSYALEVDPLPFGTGTVAYHSSTTACFIMIAVNFNNRIEATLGV